MADSDIPVRPDLTQIRIDLAELMANRGWPEPGAPPLAHPKHEAQVLAWHARPPAVRATVALGYFDCDVLPWRVHFYRRDDLAMGTIVLFRQSVPQLVEVLSRFGWVIGVPDLPPAFEIASDGTARMVGEAEVARQELERQMPRLVAPPIPCPLPDHQDCYLAAVVGDTARYECGLTTNRENGFHVESRPVYSPVPDGVIGFGPRDPA